jgi:hypothetical protein
MVQGGATVLEGWKEIGGALGLGERQAKRYRTRKGFPPLPVEKDWKGRWVSTVAAIAAWQEACRLVANDAVRVPAANDTLPPPEETSP